MEKNTVTIDLETYNELRDIKNAIAEGKTVAVSQCSVGRVMHLYSESEAVGAAGAINKVLEAEIEEHKTAYIKMDNENFALQKRLDELLKDKAKASVDITSRIILLEATLSNLSRESIWGFLKWKQTY